jgi:Icc-related predicted phosphoesterase
MIIDCISDLHGHYPELEGGDLLIVAGDLTTTCALEFQMEFNSWLYAQSQRYKKTTLIAGNHDKHLTHVEPSPLYFSTLNAKTGEQKSYAEYLCDSGTEFEGLKIWGTPWTSVFPGMNPLCKAFTCETEDDLDTKFSLIPDDIDILITHSPPWAIQDMNTQGEQVGSYSLLSQLLNRVRPKLHVFGHIHEAYGQKSLWNRTTFVNASHVNERYEPVNKPIRIEL